ncbi:uncharacterized protein E0L32_011858 [Thyridium curvatum]|uniref:Uncharacterized protein n=1 Tax=Thyridium curvatum TaxID=1093900 RepID=A0A507BKN9_9PEZI|nr:uncharacterized protein E0L32_011858 [Thyridium curvatum]TPX18039.1 hypothetical protein E0L32_011858 [Thyridium curvatum]
MANPPSPTEPSRPLDMTPSAKTLPVPEKSQTEPSRLLNMTPSAGTLSWMYEDKPIPLDSLGKNAGNTLMQWCRQRHNRAFEERASPLAMGSLHSKRTTEAEASAKMEESLREIEEHATLRASILTESAQDKAERQTLAEAARDGGYTYNPFGSLDENRAHQQEYLARSKLKELAREQRRANNLLLVSTDEHREEALTDRAYNVEDPEFEQHDDKDDSVKPRPEANPGSAVMVEVHSQTTAEDVKRQLLTKRHDEHGMPLPQRTQHVACILTVGGKFLVPYDDKHAQHLANRSTNTFRTSLQFRVAEYGYTEVLILYTISPTPGKDFTFAQTTLFLKDFTLPPQGRDISAEEATTLLRQAGLQGEVNSKAFHSAMAIAKSGFVFQFNQTALDALLLTKRKAETLALCSKLKTIWTQDEVTLESFSDVILCQTTALLKQCEHDWKIMKGKDPLDPLFAGCAKARTFNMGNMVDDIVFDYAEPSVVYFRSADHRAATLAYGAKAEFDYAQALAAELADKPCKATFIPAHRPKDGEAVCLYYVVVNEPKAADIMPVVGEHVTFKIDSHPIYLPEAPEEEFSEEEVNLQIVDHILKGYAQATRIDDQALARATVALAFMDIYDGPASEFLNFAESKLDKLTRRPKNDDIPRETVVEHRQRVLDFVTSAMEQNQIKPPKRDPAATKPSWSATRIEPVDLMANDLDARSWA